MIEPDKLKELIALMAQHDLTELDLRDEREQVKIKRASATEALPQVVPAMMSSPVAAGPQGGAAPHPGANAGQSGQSGQAESAGRDPALVAITSPMVGTFYSAPNPDSDPFVAVGAKVGAASTVCLVEAMKVFNEIKAGVSGSIEQMLVEDGQAVEFGQELMLVRP